MRQSQSFRQTAMRALVSGSVASVASTLAIALCSRRQTGQAAAGTNATSQWLFGRAALAQDAPSWKHTATGYAIHHATSLFWAVFYERYRRRGAQAARSAPLVDASATAAVAYFVDYHLTPKRLTPGFEHRLSQGALVLVYAAYAAGLAAAALRMRR